MLSAPAGSESPSTPTPCPRHAACFARQSSSHAGTTVPTGTAAKLGPRTRLANGLDSMGLADCRLDHGANQPLSGQTHSDWASGRHAAPLQRWPASRTCAHKLMGDLQRLRHQSESNNTVINRLWDVQYPPSPPRHALQQTIPQRSPYHQPSGPGHSSPNHYPVCNMAAAPWPPSGVTVTATPGDMPRQPFREHQWTRKKSSNRGGGK